MNKVVALPRVYETASPERPVPKAEIARLFGVSTRTVDRWVERDGMPERTAGHPCGCWRQVGAVRRYYPSRVRSWLDGASPSPEGQSHDGNEPLPSTDGPPPAASTDRNDEDRLPPVVWAEDVDDGEDFKARLSRLVAEQRGERQPPRCPTCGQAARWK
jgi:hypothetical protein